MTDDVTPAKFYYAYCDTEKKDLGAATNNETVAQNTADNHKAKTGHETSVDYR